jgi:hypothetical protein
MNSLKSVYTCMHPYMYFFRIYTRTFLYSWNAQAEINDVDNSLVTGE